MNAEKTGAPTGRGDDARARMALDESCLAALLEAFAVGDALGMATEFMTRGEIAGAFGFVEGFVDPSRSRNHPDLRRGQITDDTEQVVALLEEYCVRGRIDPRETAERLLRWVRESGAVEKRYIGPSSKAALQAIAEGADPAETGLRGTTCGGVMRSPAAALYALCAGLPLEKSIRACLLPTHNTRPALEAAVAYGYALRKALSGGGPEDILGAAALGASAGSSLAPGDWCAPSLASRLAHFRESGIAAGGPERTMRFLYEVFGTGLESADVAAAALCVFATAPDDPWLCLRMGASVGGDTDTIAALAGMLGAARSLAAGRGHGIPADILGEALSGNGLDFRPLAAKLASLRAGDARS